MSQSKKDQCLKLITLTADKQSKQMLVICLLLHIAFNSIYKYTLLYSRLCEWARYNKFCALIGYPSWQDGAILHARECLFDSRIKILLESIEIRK